MKIKIAILFGSLCLCAGAARGHKLMSLSQEGGAQPAPVEMTAQQDHQRMMERLHITSLRPGADPNKPNAPNAVNYDESKANPYPKLPDPLVMKNGKRVTTAKLWWNQRRAE